MLRKKIFGPEKIARNGVERSWLGIGNLSLRAVSKWVNRSLDRSISAMTR